jgi:hypothetical protein
LPSYTITRRSARLSKAARLIGEQQHGGTAWQHRPIEFVCQADAQQLVAEGASQRAAVGGEALPGARLQPGQRHGHRLAAGAALTALVRQRGDLARAQHAVACVQTGVGAAVDDGVHTRAARHLQQQHAARLALGRPVLQRAGDALQAQTVDGGQELAEQLALKFVQGLGVLFGTEQPRLVLELLQVGQAQHQRTALGVGEGANGLQGLAHHLAADTLELEPP